MRLGIDEAGRGPVLGPLVLCGVCVTDAQERQLAALAVRDSKAFGTGAAARAQRARIAADIRRVAHRVTTIVASAEDVDRWVDGQALNHLERTLAQTIIAQHPDANQIVVDGARIFQPLSNVFAHLRAENHADRNHPVVAAASIVAKVERDTLLAAALLPYQATFGPIGGGGYCNKQTAAFLAAYHAHHGALPADVVRRCWGWPPLQGLLAQS